MADARGNTRSNHVVTITIDQTGISVDPHALQVQRYDTIQWVSTGGHFTAHFTGVAATDHPVWSGLEGVPTKAHMAKAAPGDYCYGVEAYAASQGEKLGGFEDFNGMPHVIIT